MSRVDVVVPCYKYAHFLRECVTSVLTQQGVDVRVLIIDDCSPDHTPEVGQQLAVEDSRVEYRRHAVNRGHIATYNEGLMEWASGDCCLLLSADDFLLPGALERATRVMDANPTVSVCYGQVIRSNRSHTASDTAASTGNSRIIPGREYIQAVCEAGENKIETPTAVVRTRIQHQVGGYDPALPHAGDMEMWLRVAAHGDVAVIDAHQAVYRIHGNNMSDHYYAGVGDIRQRRAVFDAFFNRCRDQIDGWQQLRQHAMRATAMSAFWSASRCFDMGDSATSKALLGAAIEIWPPIRQTREWRRFAIRRVLGVRIVSKMRRTLSAVTRKTVSQSAISSGLKVRSA